MIPAAETILDRINTGVFSVDATNRVLQWNLFMVTSTGCRAEDIVGRDLFACFPELPRQWLAWKLRTVFELGNHAFSSWRNRPYVFKLPHNRPLTGGIDWMRQDVAFLPIKGDGERSGDVTSVCVVIADATDAAMAQAELEDVHRSLERALRERQRLELELRLAQKLEAIGQLAAGVAHEINTPLQFVGDTVAFLTEAFASFTELVGTYRAHGGRVPEVERAEEEADVDFLLDRVPPALARASDGIDRVARIVRAMKALSHPDGGSQCAADLNTVLHDALVVSANEYRLVADVQTDFGDIPPVRCYGSELSQVFINLIVNAAHAIQEVDRGGRGDRGVIHVATREDGGDVVVTIRDSGCGIPEGLRERVFDPFFTTKPVGKGTGQGLALARAAIARHTGSLTLSSAVGVGTTFYVRLPVQGRAGDEPAAST